MNVCSNSNLTLSSMPLSIRSRLACSWLPPRLSSQLADHFTCIGLPLIRLCGLATGKVSVAGELINVS